MEKVLEDFRDMVLGEDFQNVLDPEGFYHLNPELVLNEAALAALHPMAERAKQSCTRIVVWWNDAAYTVPFFPAQIETPGVLWGHIHKAEFYKIVHCNDSGWLELGRMCVALSGDAIEVAYSLFNISTDQPDCAALVKKFSRVITQVKAPGSGKHPFLNRPEFKGPLSISYP